MGRLGARAAAVVWLAGAAVYLVSESIAASSFPGYSYIGDYISDLGAAACLPATPEGAMLQRIEVRAWGLLLGELLDRCAAAPEAARAVERACVQPAVAARPLLAEALAMLPGG